MTVIGQVGSGKSSLLLALLGEIPSKSTTFNMNARISYVPQEAWVFHGTIRENILFGQSMDEGRYQKVLHATCLDKDIEFLSAKDRTMVGEQGFSLSGGQRARICLARYSDKCFSPSHLSRSVLEEFTEMQTFISLTNLLLLSIIR